MMMRRVHDRTRVHVSIGMMIFAGVGFATSAVINKRRVKQGNTMEKMTSEYQMEYNKRKDGELRNQKT